MSLNKKLFVAIFSLIFPIFLIEFLWAYLNLSSYTYIILSIISIIFVSLIFVFIIYLIGYKLKYRKFMLLFSSISLFLIVIINIFSMKIIEIGIYKDLKEYNTFFQNLELQKRKSGFYPEKLLNKKIIKSNKYTNYYYKTLNNQQDYVLFVAVGAGLWSHCSTKNLTLCKPDKWFILKDGKYQWIDIPDNKQNQIYTNSNINWWTTWEFKYNQ